MKKDPYILEQNSQWEYLTYDSNLAWENPTAANNKTKG